MVTLLDLVGVVSSRDAVSQCREGGWEQGALGTLLPRPGGCSPRIDEPKRRATGSKVDLGRWAAEDFVGNRGQESGGGPGAGPRHTGEGRSRT